MLLIGFSCASDKGEALNDQKPGEQAGDANCEGEDATCRIPSHCGDIEVVKVEWTENTDLQVSPEKVFGSKTGSCQAMLTWDAADFDTTNFEPPSGRSEATITVDADEQSARLLRTTAESPYLVNFGCEPSLEIDARVAIQTADGVFNDKGATTIRYKSQPGVFPFILERDLTETGGGFTVSLSEGETNASLLYRVDTAGQACLGELDLSIRDDWGPTVGHLGTWSGTGCPEGQSPVEIDAEAIAAVWNDVSIPGVWDDGKTAELRITIDVDVQMGCLPSGSSRQDVIIPGRITYSTSDGRIGEHTTEVDLTANFVGDGSVRGLECYIDDSLECTDMDNAIDYQLNDCNAMESARITFYIRGNKNKTRLLPDGMFIVEYHRESITTPGVADQRYLFKPL